MNDTPCFVGIDVAKAPPRRMLPAAREYLLAVANDSPGVKAALVKALQPLHPALVVLEPTGGPTGARTVAALAASGIPVAVVNPLAGSGTSRGP